MATRTTLAPIDDFRRRFRDAHTRRALDELRHQVAAQIRQAADDMDEGGNSDDDKGLQALFDDLRELLAQLDAKISRNAVVDDLNVRTSHRGAADDRFDTSLPEFSIRGMLASAIGHPIPGLDIGRSIEISTELRQRSRQAPQGFWAPIQALYLSREYARKLERRQDTISTGLPPGGPGGNLIPLTLDAARYIDALRARTVIIQAGAQTINDLVGNLDIPKMTATGQVSWFNEGDTITQSEEQFDRFHLDRSTSGV